MTYMKETEKRRLKQKQIEVLEEHKKTLEELKNGVLIKNWQKKKIKKRF